MKESLRTYDDNRFDKFHTSAEFSCWNFLELKLIKLRQLLPKVNEINLRLLAQINVDLKRNYKARKKSA